MEEAHLSWAIKGFVNGPGWSRELRYQDEQRYGRRVCMGRREKSGFSVRQESEPQKYFLEGVPRHWFLFPTGFQMLAGPPSHRTQSNVRPFPSYLLR